MKNIYQNQGETLPLSSFAPYVSDSSNSLWKKGIGNSVSTVSNFVQSTEKKLSQWFWDGIGSLPKNYFSKDITQVNCFDKSLWEGIFNEQIEVLQEQLLSELQPQRSGGLQEIKDVSSACVDKLKEQIAAGLPKGKFSLEEQLIQLQGLVGKYMLSPSCYEEGLDRLKETSCDNNHYRTLIEKVKSSFHSELKKQPEFVAECFQGDVLFSFNESSEKMLTAGAINKTLNYYKPLMKHKAYAIQKGWLEQCYNTQSILPPPSVLKKQTTASSLPTNLPTNDNKQSSLTWQGALYNFGKFLWDNSGKLVTLGLATQVAAVQASNNATQEGFVPEDNFTDRSSMMPMLDINQTFLALNTNLLRLNQDYVNNPNAELGTLVPLNKSIEAKTTIDGYGLDDKVAVLPINATAISEVDQHDQHVGISEALRQEILHQFDIISTDLHKLLKNFSTNQDNNKPLEERSDQTALPRVVRNLPVDDSPMCEIEQVVLINFRNELQTTLNGTNQAGSNNCPLNYSSDMCEDLVKLVLCGYNHLKNGFEATRNSIAVDEATMWENKLNDYKEKSTRLLNDKIKSLSGKYNRDIADLETKMQKLQKQANLYLKTIRGYGPEVCAYRITDGNIQGAVDKFKQLRDEFEVLEDVIIRSIIKKVYKLERIENIVNFVKKLPSCNQDRIAYPALFDEMNKQNHLTSPKVLIVSDAVKGCMKSSDLYNNLEKYVATIIDAWAYKVSNNDYEQFIERLKEGYGQFFDDRWSRIIEKAYANKLYNAERILKFIRGLPYINQTARSLTALLNQMGKSGHLHSYQLLMVADKIKQELDFVNNDSNSVYVSGDRQYYKKAYEDLKESLPSSVRGLIWSSRSSCVIQNNAYLEYLYASYCTGCAGLPFTWVPGGFDGYSYWELRMYNNGKYFTMRNTAMSRYLHQSAGNPSFIPYSMGIDKTRSFVDASDASLSFGDSNKWRLIPTDDNKYLILNVASNGYLYADNAKLDPFADPNKRRYVLLWQSSSVPDSVKKERKWSIDCSGNQRLTSTGKVCPISSSNNANYGCHKGSCWAYCGASYYGGEWCYTIDPDKEWVKCSAKHECCGTWRCGGSCTL
ncbi:hypothetical protein [Candidatus Cardinium sp. TP]|uniref:hypothetical protein n=1 Tax=Candidatus Cardinium sp. TP TaxID=2961955 RepID=UPI0021AEEE42|nr:hypothetical protein [Candidatus Cardinium sp. TP]MCT4697242.1 hypothetical protein [Candidatus Cardinium sp. TP]